MTIRAEIFDGAATPLAQGVTLIEASAGTGKTFAISMLVLRAVVELGVNLKEILVVTYTVAATEELRGRIRSRLVEARTALRDPAAEKDPALNHWVARIDDPAEALHRLELALLDIDSMGIHTIHGFCQRVLAEQVLESGHFFTTELIADTSTVRLEIVNEFWRRLLYAVDERYASLIAGAYRDPRQLYGAIRGADQPLNVLVPENHSFADACSRLDSSSQRFRDWWSAQGGELAEQFAGAAAQGYLNKEAAVEHRSWMAHLESSSHRGSSPDPAIVERLLADNLVSDINGRKVRGEDKKRAFLAGWTLPGEVAESYLEAVDNLLLAVRLELALILRSELPDRLHDRGLVSFDELITDLHRALRSTGGELLARQVGARFKVALIDEFQDTDGAQYEIFSRLFGRGTHHLYLIGDPKQAIYRFRGADIHSYLEARTHVDRRLTLDCNYRSNPALVQAVNELLDNNEFGGTPYQPVRSPAGPYFQRLVEGDQEQPGLIYCQLDRDPGESGWSVAEAETQIRSWVVNEVVRLVDPDCSRGIVCQDAAGDELRRAVRPSDIGVLVRTNRQAEEFFSEFSRRSIPAVLSSSKDVFQTGEAADLLLVLRAVAAPADGRLLRTVLGLDWFGLSGERYFLICRDDNRFGGFRENFHEYHRQWHDSGLLLMMNNLLEKERVFLNLSGKPQAERRITNIQHVLELVQQQQVQRRLSNGQTLVWFQQRLTDSAAVEEGELRLASDREAVNVVTMHSAKGLEYEIVFCPFLFRSTIAAAKSGPVSCFDPEKGRIFDLGSADYAHHAQLARQEEVDEEMRLTYVAITRARLRAYLIWAELKTGARVASSFNSPLGRLLFPGGERPFSQQRQELMSLGALAHCQYRLIETDQPALPYELSGPAPGLLRARPYSPTRLRTNRMRTSFSGLTMHAKHQLHHLDEQYRAGDERDGTPLPAAAGLPAGVRFGNLIHDALEMFSFKDLGSDGFDVGQLDPLLRRYHYDIDPAPIRTLLYNTVTTPLARVNGGDGAFSLASLEQTQMVKEMEFSLHLEPLATMEVNQILAQEPTVTALEQRRIEGYLNGFIDLIFCHQGCYYIADYKTNNLGGAGSYGPEDLVKSMQAHNYGMQYWLYSLVVHRFLQNWLNEYRYDLHFGGVFYLFVRGMHPGQADGVFFARPAEAALQQLDQLFGTGGVGDNG